MFIGRQNELKELNERLLSQKFEMSPIYGRRRVGKTRLLEEFVSDKDTVNTKNTYSNLRFRFDLHGFSLDEANEQVKKIIFSCFIYIQT